MRQQISQAARYSIFIAVTAIGVFTIVATGGGGTPTQPTRQPWLWRRNQYSISMYRIRNYHDHSSEPNWKFWPKHIVESTLFLFGVFVDYAQ